MDLITKKNDKRSERHTLNKHVHTVSKINKSLANCFLLANSNTVVPTGRMNEFLLQKHPHYDKTVHVTLMSEMCDVSERV